MKNKSRRIVRKYRGDKSKPQPTDFLDYTSQPLVVDLSLKESERWGLVIQQESATAEKLVTGAIADFPALVRVLAGVGLGGIFGEVYRMADGPYVDEIRAWAKALKVDAGLLTMINCAYESEQLREAVAIPWTRLGQIIFGCSAAVVELADNELVHVRTLDWPIAGMGPATRVFKFVAKDRNFFGVSFPGAIGLLSGMLPRAYSVTINWAPPQTLPSLENAPSLLLRRVLEECDTYEAAVDRLMHSRLCTSVFFTVCGVSDGQGCVIERIPDDYCVRPLKGGFAVQTNHHDDAGWLRGCNKRLDFLKDDPLVLSTRDRRRDLENALCSHVGKPADSKQLFAVLDQGEVVTNFETCQRIIFRPARGEWFLQTIKRKPLV